MEAFHESAEVKRPPSTFLCPARFEDRPVKVKLGLPETVQPMREPKDGDLGIHVALHPFRHHPTGFLVDLALKGRGQAGQKLPDFSRWVSAQHFRKFAGKAHNDLLEPRDRIPMRAIESAAPEIPALKHP